VGGFAGGRMGGEVRARETVLVMGRMLKWNPSCLAAHTARLNSCRDTAISALPQRIKSTPATNSTFAKGR
jgi:hypothetical protein